MSFDNRFRSGYNCQTILSRILDDETSAWDNISLRRYHWISPKTLIQLTVNFQSPSFGLMVSRKIS